MKPTDSKVTAQGTARRGNTARRKLAINRQTIRALESVRAGDGEARVTIVIRCASDNTDCCRPDGG